jgi:hypothetical protein
MGVSVSAATANPTFTTLHGTACSIDRNHDPQDDFSSDGIVDVVNRLTFVQGYWPQ